MERETNFDELQEFFADDIIAFLNDENTPIEPSLTAEGLEPVQKDTEQTVSNKFRY